MFERVKKKVVPEKSVAFIQTMSEKLVQYIDPDIDPDEDELTAAANKVRRKVSSLAIRKARLVKEEGELVEELQEIYPVEGQPVVSCVEHSPQQEEKKLRAMDEQKIMGMLQEKLSPKQISALKDLVSDRKEAVTRGKPSQLKFDDTLAFWNEKVEQSKDDVITQRAAPQVMKKT